MSSGPRYLFVGAQGDLPPGWQAKDTVLVANWTDAQLALQHTHFDAVYINHPADQHLAATPTYLNEKLDSLFRAGLELTSLDLDRLPRLSPTERIDILKQNILKQIRQLLNYDHVDIRLLQPDGTLEPLASEGMSAEVSQLKLKALPTGHGTSGYVAATGKTYYCRDCCNDPLYIAGCTTTRSSVTVPILHQHEIIGVLTVDSPEINGFSDTDINMLELFGREIGAGLHTLRMLSIERHGVARQSVEAISQEVAIPVDAILNSTAYLLNRYIGLDHDMTEKLQEISKQARSIRKLIQEVGETFKPHDSHEMKHIVPMPLKDVRVLVVDADDRIRRSAHAILARLGCIVETACDGQQAIAMARASRYDFVLCDINLPDMIGYDLFRQLRQDNPMLDVVLMNGYGYDPSHSIVRANMEGLTGALYKPFRVDQLLDVLEKGSSITKTVVPSSSSSVAS